MLSLHRVGIAIVTVFAKRAISPIIAIMFYEVHILDRRGKIKKVLSSKFLSKRHWNLFPETTSRKAGLKKSQSENPLNQHPITLDTGQVLYISGEFYTEEALFQWTKIILDLL